jgi:hypothetical protein
VKALTVKPPWSWAIIYGGKDVENRTWKTDYRGELLIHSGKAWSTEGASNTMVKNAFERANPALHYPLYEAGGVALGVVDLVGCIEDSESLWAMPGHWHWVLTNPRPLIEPLPMRGALSLWDVPPAIPIRVAA